MVSTITHAHTLPPLGAMVCITDPAAGPNFQATVDMHLGRYFYAGGYRFHVADDFKPMGDRRVWKTAAATVVLLTHQDAVAPPVASDSSPTIARVTGFPDLEPVGLLEPNELW